MKKNRYKKNSTQILNINSNTATEKFFAKKSLGQNFLRSESALQKIVLAGEITKKDAILEIGPGQGALTEKILKEGSQVVAIEKDRDLIPLLTEKFKKEIQEKKLVLIEGDILKLSLKEIGITKPYKLIANIPYYITGEIFKSFLEERERQPEIVVVLIQKEVAQRIMAKDKKENILSLSVKVYGSPKIVSIVPRGAFTPSPKVDSAIIAIKNISKKNFKNKEAEKKFFMLIRTGFSHKRKKLIQNIKGLSKSNLPALFKKMGLEETKRAEDIELKDWLDMIENI